MCVVEKTKRVDNKTAITIVKRIDFDHGSNRRRLSLRVYALRIVRVTTEQLAEFSVILHKSFVQNCLKFKQSQLYGFHFHQCKQIFVFSCIMPTASISIENPTYNTKALPT